MAPFLIGQEDSVAPHSYDDLQFDLSEFGIFEEIESLAVDTIPDFDNTMIMEDNGLLPVDLPLPPAATPATPQAVVVQPAAPDNSAVYDAFSNLQDLQPVSPEMFLMPPSDAAFLRPASPGAFLQPASPGALLQPASPGILLQPASPGILLQPASPGASSESFLQSLSPAECSSLEPEYLQPQVVQFVQPVTMKPAVPVLSASTLKMEVTPAEEASEMPKKRGRKPKYPKGMAPPRRSRPRKQKVYEMGPLSDETEEKKRKNAINAKNHRDKQKQIKDTLAIQLQKVTAERDHLLKLVENLKQSESNLKLLPSKAM